MISQKTGEGKSLWRPNFSSLISESAFLAFSSGDSTIWSGGSLVFNDPDAMEDAPFFRGIARHYNDGKAVPWITRVVAALDELIPAPALLLQSFDDCAMNISSSPAAFRIPQVPSVEDVARCLVASRCLIRIGSELVFPVSVSEAQGLDQLDYASELCVIIGGERGLLTAMAWLQDDRSYLHD